MKTQQIRINETPTCTTLEEARAAIVRSLSASNGRRRRRTLDYDDVVGTIKAALSADDRFDYELPRGRVTTMLFNKSYATGVAAIFNGGLVKLAIEVVDGRRSTMTIRQALGGSISMPIDVAEQLVSTWEDSLS